MNILNENVWLSALYIFYFTELGVRKSSKSFFFGWIKRDQLDVTCFFISLFLAQHVSDVNTSILKSLRLICWVISWDVLLWYDACWCYVVVWLGWCGIWMQASACVWIPHHVLILKPVTRHYQHEKTEKQKTYIGCTKHMCVNIWIFIVMLRHFWETYRFHTEDGISGECSCLASGVFVSDWNLTNKKENFSRG